MGPVSRPSKASLPATKYKGYKQMGTTQAKRSSFKNPRAWTKNRVFIT
jgi:hypothetical protein